MHSPCQALFVDGPSISVLGVVAGEAADIITQTAAGEVAVPGDVDSVAAAMSRMRNQPSRRGVASNPPAGQNPRDWVIRHASAAAMGRTYERVLEQVVS